MLPCTLKILLDYSVKRETLEIEKAADVCKIFQKQLNVSLLQLCKKFSIT